MGGDGRFMMRCHNKNKVVIGCPSIRGGWVRDGDDKRRVGPRDGGRHWPRDGRSMRMGTMKEGRGGRKARMSEERKKDA